MAAVGSNGAVSDARRYGRAVIIGGSFATHFQRSYPKVVAPAWLLATSADLEWLGRPGTPTLQERVADWYLPKMLDASIGDRRLTEAFLEVQNLMKPATSLFSPGVAMRVFRHGLGGKKPAAAPVAGAAPA